MNLRKLLIVWLFLIFLLTSFATFRYFFLERISGVEYQYPDKLPKVNRFIVPPAISAKSALVLDVDSGVVLFEKKPHSRLHPASITKMVTAIAALEIYPMDEVVTVKNEYLVGKNMELAAGEKIKVEDLIYGLLVHSANDAAYVLAGQDSERVKEFVQRMNLFVSDLGLEDTHFVNFDGEDDYDHYSSAFDLGHLARWALNNEIFSQAVGLKEKTVTSVDGTINHHLIATNELLGVIPEVKGIKTGWTPVAGECFVGLIDLGEKKVITVILGSENRFEETMKLINWVKEAVSWQDYDSIHSADTAGM